MPVWPEATQRPMSIARKDFMLPGSPKSWMSEQVSMYDFISQLALGGS